MDVFLGSLAPTLRRHYLDTMRGVKPAIISTYSLAEHNSITKTNRALMDLHDAKQASFRYDLRLIASLGKNANTAFTPPELGLIEGSSEHSLAELDETSESTHQESSEVA